MGADGRSRAARGAIRGNKKIMMDQRRGKPTGSNKENHHVEGKKGGGQTDGDRGVRNRPVEREFRRREGHWVAGSGRK